MNNNYFIDFNTGVGNKHAESLEEAMEIAETNLAYTQQSVKIYNTEDNSLVAKLPWWGTEPSDDDIVTAKFGGFGFYGEWEEY